MAQQTGQPGQDADRLDDGAESNPEENRAQRDSDAAPDALAEAPGSRVDSERSDGRGSDANGIPAFDEADGEIRKKLYRDGAELVSRID
jgi:hypothetical protein